MEIELTPTILHASSRQFIVMLTDKSCGALVAQSLL
jgi:hypothetical protein